VTFPVTASANKKLSNILKQSLDTLNTFVFQLSKIPAITSVPSDTTHTSHFTTSREWLSETGEEQMEL